MADPFVAEIRVSPYTFAPKGWAWCDGQLIPPAQNPVLFKLLGIIYGGDGTATFALPNLQGRAAMHPVQGSGLSPRTLGEQGGSDAVTLLDSETPVHTHFVQASNFTGDVQSPSPDTTLARSRGGNAYTSETTQNMVEMAPQALPPAGGGLPHNNLMPYLTLHVNIALQGVFPPRPE